MWEGVQPRREEGIGTGGITRAFEQLNEPSRCVKRIHSEDEMILTNIWRAVPSKQFLWDRRVHALLHTSDLQEEE